MATDLLSRFLFVPDFLSSRQAVVRTLETTSAETRLVMSSTLHHLQPHNYFIIP